MTERRIGIQELARIAGVHPSTVSRALNGSKLIKEETRREICDLAAKHGYIPDDVAKSLSQGKTSALGILVPEISNSFYAQIVDAIEGVMTPKGYSIILAGTRFDPETELQAIRTMASKRVDGLVVCAPSEEGEAQLEKLSSRIPVILCDTYKESSLDRVYVDEEKGMQQGLSYLLSKGHTAIGCISDRHTGRRMNLFARMLKENGIGMQEEHFFRGTDSGVESGYKGLCTMLEKGSLPGAIFAARDNIAVGILRAAAEHGIRIPEELSILGYDDIPISDYLHKKLTTIRQPAARIGQETAAILLRRLADSKRQEAVSVGLVPELVARESA